MRNWNGNAPVLTTDKTRFKINELEARKKARFDKEKSNGQAGRGKKIQRKKDNIRIRKKKITVPLLDHTYFEIRIFFLFLTQRMNRNVDTITYVHRKNQFFFLSVCERTFNWY